VLARRIRWTLGAVVEQRVSAGRRARRWAVARVAAALLLAGCAGSDATSTSSPATDGTTGASVPASVEALLGQLRVAPEADGGSYDRELFGDWRTVDGCTTRERVLIEESLSPPQVDPFGCKVIAGDWVSVYDGAETSDPTDLEIDHLVPVREAWVSGASAWGEGRRVAFYNDMGFAGSLVAVTSKSNQAKGASDPSDWRTPRAEARCRYAWDWVQVKLRWDLSADADEVAALEDMLAGCDLSGLPPADGA
jgi:hypothetical protein